MQDGDRRVHARRTGFLTRTAAIAGVIVLGLATGGCLTKSYERGYMIPEGALLYFGEGGRITHVAISLGEGRFIHSYGDVRINSLLENDPAYEEKLAKIYLFSRDLLS